MPSLLEKLFGRKAPPEPASARLDLLCAQAAAAETLDPAHADLRGQLRE